MQAVKTVIPNQDVAALYRGAKVNLNHHRTTTMHGSGAHIPVGSAESLGPRAYEIAACGGFQLMDDSRKEAGDIFGDALATYKAGDPADLVAQARYWVEHPAERAMMARAQREAVAPHSWHARAADLLNILDLTPTFAEVPYGAL
jgi:spore maturation protein CgeB